MGEMVNMDVKEVMQQQVVVVKMEAKGIMEEMGVIEVMEGQDMEVCKIFS